MSHFKKNALAVALAAGLGFAGAASAFDANTGNTEATYNDQPVKVATADIANATTVLGVDENLNVVVQADDRVLGRTTGFSVRIDLTNGAKFAANPAFVTGPGATGWVPSQAAGGTGFSYVIIRMDPDTDETTASALQEGIIVALTRADTVVNPTSGLRLNSLTALQAKDAVVSAKVTFIDPVTAADLLTDTTPLLQSGNPVELGCDAEDGDTTKRVDVAETEAHGAKTYFSSSGAIGEADDGFINLGSIGASVADGFSSFRYTSTDTFTTVVSGKFDAFKQAGAGVFLSVDGTCNTADVTGTINTTNNTVTFTYTGADVGIDEPATGFNAAVCAEVPSDNETVIDATAVSATTTFNRGGVSATNANCPLLPIQYNGSVVEVFAINPAGNSTAQSFLRVINRSSTPGKVTLVGIDDNGQEGASPITFTLGAGKSMQINSEDLEKGSDAKGLSGSWGDGAGKWRAIVTGEFTGMRVQSLNRNATDGTVTNLTDADGHGEQLWNQAFDNSNGNFLPY